MDYEDDVIDLTWMTKEELNEYMRHLSDLTSCPCVNCIINCDPVRISRCYAYQQWLTERMANREAMGS